MNAVGGFMAGSIVAKLLLDKTGWNESIKAVGKDTKGLEAAAKNITTAFIQVGKMMVVAAIAAGGAIVAMVKKTAEAGDAIYDMSQRTGIAAETLSGLKLAADKSGTSLEGVAVGLRFLGRSMVAASEGTEMSAEAFAALGISVTDANGKLRPMQGVMLDVADRFARMEDGAQKTALAIKLFGRSGTELIPMMNLGSAGLREQIELAEKLGIVFTSKTAAAADRLMDAMVDLKGAFAGMRNDISNALIPVFAQLAEGVTTALTYIRSKVAEFAESGKLQEWALSAARVFISAFKLMAKAVEGLMLILPSLKAAIFSVAEGFYKTLGKIAEGISTIPGVSAHASVALKVWAADLQDFAATYGKAADYNIEKASDIVAGFDVLFEALNMVSAGFGKMGKMTAKTTELMDGASISTEALARNLDNLVTQIEQANALGPVEIEVDVEPILDNMFPPAMGETIVDEFVDMGAELSAEATKAAKGVKKAFGTLPDYFAGLYNDIANGFANAFERLFEGMSDADKKRKAQLQQSMKDITDAYKAGEISLEEYTEKYKAAYDEMQGITSGFARFFKDIWQTIKQAFFKVIGEMVAKFVVGFVQNIVAGMGIVKAATSAFNAFSAAAGTAATGTAQAVTTGAAGATGAAAGAGAALGMAATAGFLAVWTPMFIGAISGIFNFNKPKSKEQLQAELDWIEALKVKWRTEGRTEDWITNQLKNLDWWKSEPGTRGAVGQPDRRWATGFEGIITTPTTALFGEAGPEYVSVQPMTGARPAMAMAGAGGTGSAMVTLNMNGPLISTTGVSRQDLEAASEQFVLMVQRQLRRVGRTI